MRAETRESRECPRRFKFFFPLYQVCQWVAPCAPVLCPVLRVSPVKLFFTFYLKFFFIVQRAPGSRAKCKKERKKRENPREGWEDGTPPPHRDFKERGVRERFFNTKCASRRPPLGVRLFLSLFAVSRRFSLQPSCHLAVVPLRSLRAIFYTFILSPQKILFQCGACCSFGFRCPESSGLALGTARWRCRAMRSLGLSRL